MRIGLTYDLRDDYLAAGFTLEETAEFDRPDTIDSLESAIRGLGHATDRIGNAASLMQRLASGLRWDMVFNIAEGLHGFGREALVPAILDHYDIPYTFSDPLALAVTLHKETAKRVVRDAGLPTPEFAVVERPDDSDRVDLPLPLFVKPVAEGTGKGISAASVVRRRDRLRPACEKIIAAYHQPALVEVYLPGRELTVGLIGTGAASSVLGTLEIAQLPGAEKDAYSFVNKERCEELVEYRLVRPEKDGEVRQAEAVALKAWRALGCRDAGRIDLRSDAQGAPHFLEANPLAGLHPRHSDLPILCSQLGIEYTGLIRRILDSALARLPRKAG